jgi:hypothetical protein
MFSVIANIYNKKTKRKVKRIFHSHRKIDKVYRQLETFDVCTTGDTAHIDTIFKFLPHSRQHVCIDILQSRIIVAVENIDAPMLTRVWQ